MSKLIEPRFRAPRLWSNAELKKILTVIDKYDSVVNVSGWKDIDKEGGAIGIIILIRHLNII